MPLMYPVKRVFRSWKLFVALLIGVVLASTSFLALHTNASVSPPSARFAFNYRFSRHSSGGTLKFNAKKGKKLESDGMKLEATLFWKAC